MTWMTHTSTCVKTVCTRHCSRGVKGVRTNYMPLYWQTLISIAGTELGSSLAGHAQQQTCTCVVTGAWMRLYSVHT